MTPIPLLLLLAPAHAAPGAQNISVAAFPVEQSGDVTVSVSVMGLDPTETVTCEARQTDGGAGVKPGTAGQTIGGFSVTFPALANGTWGVACDATTLKRKDVYAVTAVNIQPPPAPAVAVPARTKALYDATTKNPPTLSATASTPAPGEGRSAVPAIVTDTLQILAEIAYDKAKSRSYVILAEQVTNLVCEKAVLAEPLTLAYSPKGSPVGSNLFALKLPAGRLLSATCSAVGGLDSFVAWANAGPAIASAVEADALDVGGAALTGMSSGALSAWQNTQVSFVLGAVHTVLRDDVVNHTKPDATDATALLFELSRHDWGNLAGTDLPDLEWNGKAWDPATRPKFAEVEQAIAYGLQLSFAMAGNCTPKGGASGATCGVKDVLGYVADPSTYPSAGTAPDQWEEIRPQVGQLALSIYALVQPNVKDPIRATVVAAVDVLDLALAVDTSETVGTGTDIRTMLEQARPLFVAILDSDITGAVTAGLDIVRTVLELAGADAAETAGVNSRPMYLALQAVTRVAPVVTTIASNAQSLKQANSADEATQQALRDARKESLKALVDASTRRDGRWGAAIVGLGANVGVAPVAWTNKNEWTVIGGLGESAPDALAALPISLPMGVGLDWYPGRKPPEHGWRAGIHTQLSFVDLAQFLPDSALSGDSTTDVQWADFAMIGGQVGLDVGRPQDTFNVSADFRYAPYEQDAQYRFAVQLSYYVPFFDFN